MRSCDIDGYDAGALTEGIGGYSMEAIISHIGMTASKGIELFAVIENEEAGNERRAAEHY